MKKLNCEICGAIHNLDRHHVIPKRMGGRKDPAINDEANLVSLCRTCHGKIHQGLWDLIQTEEGIWVLDKHTGETVMRRLRKSDLDAASLFQLLNHVEGSLSQLFQALPYLPDDMLVEVFSYAASFGKRAWLIRAAIEILTKPVYDRHPHHSGASVG